MNNIQKLENLVTTPKLEPYIRLIRFPRYKNLEFATEINFTFPITALIGPNGTNKSSILRALQACPNQYDIGDYWFDTPLDKIGDDEKELEGPNRYIHGYLTPTGALAEVIKARVGKTTRGADYFETSAPRRRDGMSAMPDSGNPRDANYRSKTRWKPIEKNVVYLDFRQEIPAYDIRFYFNWQGKDNDIASKKAQIRRGGPHVSHAIQTLSSNHLYYGKNRILEKAEKLSENELQAVSHILQRNYTSIGLVKHGYFGVEGYTAQLAVGDHAYSEAYAGSGEFAAIMLVRAISRAPIGSLILLDEPETSLHPGAQRGLMEFIADCCVKYKHQVVLATHSPAIVEDLPDSGRKLLDVNPSSGRVRLVSEAASVGEAFTRLGANYSPSSVIVEDKLARAFVLRAAQIKGQDFINSISVQFLPGGVDGIIQRIAPAQAQLKSRCTILLDGDARPPNPIAQESDVLDSDLLVELMKIGIKDKHLFRDSGSDPDGSIITENRRRTLRWINKHLGFLPGNGNPEQLLMDLVGEPRVDSHAAKTYWTEQTRIDLNLPQYQNPTSEDIFYTQRKCLANLKNDNLALMKIVEILETMVPS